MNRKARSDVVNSGLAILLVLVFAGTVAGAEGEQKRVEVGHPNLLLNQEEIEQVKVKIREEPWAGRLLERVKAKAQKDGTALESALAYALSGENKFGEAARRNLLNEARSQMPGYEKLDIKAEPEWGRWTWWGATAWAYDLTYNTFSVEERAPESGIYDVAEQLR